MSCEESEPERQSVSAHEVMERESEVRLRRFSWLIVLISRPWASSTIASTLLGFKQMRVLNVMALSTRFRNTNRSTLVRMKKGPRCVKKVYGLTSSSISCVVGRS